MADTNITIVFDDTAAVGDGKGTPTSPTLPLKTPSAKSPDIDNAGLKNAQSIANAALQEIPGGNKVTSIASAAKTGATAASSGNIWVALAIIAIKLTSKIYKEVKEINADKRRAGELQRRSGNAEYYRRTK